MQALRLKYAERNIRARRDQHGVPHVEAESWHDALYGLGYVHALDRPTQMLFSRAIASGRSAELIANRPELVEADLFFRRAGLYRLEQQELQLLRPDVLEQLQVYCQGVNHGLRQSGRTLPMWATGFRPTPWDAGAVLLLGNLLSYGSLVVGQQHSERLILELVLAGVDDARMRELFSPQLDAANFDLFRQLRMSRQLSDEALDLIAELPQLAGSNAWAVSPGRSATGGALLAADPHLEINRLPAIWYEAVLNWSTSEGEQRHVLGATLPGCPLLAVARTPNLAWGVTYLKGDTADFLVEDCRQTTADAGWEYRRGEVWLPFAVREETIVRKGQAPVTQTILYNDQGTLECTPEPGEAGLYLSQTWVGQQPGVGAAIGIWLDVVQADTALAAMDIVQQTPQPTLCWVFADALGHIGLQGCGWFPHRPGGQSGLLPVPAWEEKNHWQGRLSPQVLPRIYDPPEGYIASANEDVNPISGAQLTTLPLTEYRRRRIDQRLAELPQATLADMQSLQYDVLSLQAQDLLSIFLPYLADDHPVKQRLSDWDFCYTPESNDATLFARFYRNVLLEIFGQSPREQGGIGWRRMLYLCSRAGYSLMMIACVDRLLRRETSLWWQHRNKAELIRTAADKLLQEPELPWGEFNSFRFQNRFFPSGKVSRALGFDSRKLAMPGCHATVFQGHLLTAARRESTFAPSYHFVTDLSQNYALTNLPGGAAESRFSKFYRSDIPLWQAGKFKKLKPDSL